MITIVLLGTKYDIFSTNILIVVLTEVLKKITLNLQSIEIELENCFSLMRKEKGTVHVNRMSQVETFLLKIIITF